MIPKHRTTLPWLLAVVVLAVVAGVILLRVKKVIPDQPIRNVILISIDTCRADRLGCYGYEGGATPNLDALASEGFLFRHATTPVPVTLPSHCSMLTGMLPPSHGVHSNISYRLRASSETLAEMLKARGFRTGAVVGGFPLAPQFGLDQGFDHYDATFSAGQVESNVDNERSADSVNGAALAWLRQNHEERFFLFVHYFDPHTPYAPPLPYAATYADEPYVGEIAFVDHCIGAFLAEVDRLGLADSTMVLVTSDHGEGLGDHGEATHGYFIYHSTTRVLLLLKVPGRHGPRVIDEKVSLIDIVPSIIELVQAPLPAELHGRSFAGLLGGKPSEEQERFLFTESLTPSTFGSSALLGLETSRWKYIHTTRPELYDLQNDPGELTNVIAAHPDVAQTYKTRLQALLESIVPEEGGVAESALDAESIRRLESLGYVEGGTIGRIDMDTNHEDPKDFYPYFEKLGMATVAVEKDSRGLVSVPGPDGTMIRDTGAAIAIRLCEEVLTDRPDNERALYLRAKAAAGAGDTVAADRYFTELLSIHPDSREGLNGLGRLRRGQGRLADSIALYQRVIELESDENEPRNIDMILTLGTERERAVRTARNGLADTFVQLRDMQAAYEQMREVVRMDPSRSVPQFRLGLLAGELGRHEEAVKAFRTALELNPDFARARAALQKELQRTGQDTAP